MRKLKRIAIILLALAMVLCLCACSSTAEQEENTEQEERKAEESYAEAYKLYYTEHDYNAAFQLLKENEDSGYAPILELLGDCYSEEKGTELDFAEAFRLYTLAAEQGNALAMADLGWAYKASEGTEYDRGLSDQWYEQAAAAMEEYIAANPEAMDIAVYYYSLAQRYFNASGVERDYDKAIELTQRAADMGFAPAISRIGEVYDSGSYGIEQDYAKAMEL